VNIDIVSEHRFCTSQGLLGCDACSVALGYLKNIVSYCNTTQHHNPEDDLNFHYCDNFKCHIIILSLTPLQLMQHSSTRNKISHYTFELLWPVV